MFAVCVFAQPSVQPVDANEPVLLDSLETDLLSKISLANDVDTSTIVDTNKVEHIDAGDVSKFDSTDVINSYYPSGFTIEAAYAGPTILQLRLFGGRESPEKIFKNKRFSFGYAAVYLDIDFQRYFVSDEFLFFYVLYLLSGNLFSGKNGEPSGTWGKIVDISAFLINGNTNLSLTENARIGLFETHHFVDYLFSGLSSSYGWEFGWSQAVGLRYVYSGNAKDGGAYIDLGAHARITNKHFLFGVFVQLGIFSTHT
jgi:hypothetical protein